ncbi:MAG TPA: Asd/ArgC dimerization domain-containing protein [Thermoanaerobaculia bacterium]|nr:Asd/ArgC dimerization domain-containing protein [Thermoanaerobaculia bacterium]
MSHVLAIVEATTLLGKEVRDTLVGKPGSWREIRLLTTREEEVGALSEVAGAAALVLRADADGLSGVDLVFCCGTDEEARQVLAVLPETATAVVLAANLEDYAAIAGQPLPPIVAGVNFSRADQGRVLLSPHPAVVLLAHLLHPLRGLGIEEAVATVIQPASMHGDPGIDELFEQTRQILTMTQRRPTPIFGTQLAFNLLPTPAPTEPLSKQLHAVLAGDPPVSLQMLQGGVFHSLAASLYVRFVGRTDAKSLRRTLGQQPHLELAKKPQYLGPIDAAAQGKVLVGAVAEELSTPGGFWLWAVMDNLTRGGALNAVEIAEEVL